MSIDTDKLVTLSGHLHHEYVAFYNSYILLDTWFSTIRALRVKTEYNEECPILCFWHPEQWNSILIEPNYVNMLITLGKICKEILPRINKNINSNDYQDIESINLMNRDIKKLYEKLGYREIRNFKSHSHAKDSNTANVLSGATTDIYLHSELEHIASLIGQYSRGVRQLIGENPLVDLGLLDKNDIINIFIGAGKWNYESSVLGD